MRVRHDAKNDNPHKLTGLCGVALQTLEQIPAYFCGGGVVVVVVVWLCGCDGWLVVVVVELSDFFTLLCLP